MIFFFFLVPAIKLFSAYGQPGVLLGLRVLVFCGQSWHGGKASSLRARGWVTLPLSLPLPGPGSAHKIRVGSVHGKDISGLGQAGS